MLTQAENDFLTPVGPGTPGGALGPIANGTAKHLSCSDRGVVVYRRLSKENIERVQQGLDPFGLIRNSAHEMIDTNLMESIGSSARRVRPTARQHELEARLNLNLARGGVRN